MTVLRALLFNVWFFGLTIVIGVAALPVPALVPRHAYAVARTWTRLVLWGARVFCGIRVTVTGAENLPATGPALIASQHQSAFDTMIWLSLVPCARYVVKRELTRVPLFGPLLVPAGMIPVARDAGATAMRGLLRGATDAAGAGAHIIIFPEGTRVAPGERVALQPGVAAIARHLNLPVIPVATDSGTRWGRRAFLKHAGTIHVDIGTAIPAGTPRQALLAAIDSHWRDAAEHRFGPVHNSVGE
jgi:1-acyl-sn-glycerol-3-phosphate acyltransferase